MLLSVNLEFLTTAEHARGALSLTTGPHTTASRCVWSLGASLPSRRPWFSTLIFIERVSLTIHSLEGPKRPPFPAIPQTCKHVPCCHTCV